MKKGLKFIKSVSTPLLLTTIALILFLGLFKNEIRMWKFNNWPGFREKQIIIPKTCTKKVNNPAYFREYSKQYSIAYKECPDKFLQLHPGEINPIIDDMNLYNKLKDERKKCIDDLLNKSGLPPSVIDENYNCNEKLSETWFYAFGKYWFKK